MLILGDVLLVVFTYIVILQTEDTNALFDINEWGDDSANMNVGGLDIDIDDEYEGALDLDDFDAQF